jgi:uncharacterized protein (DUF58 family)
LALTGRTALVALLGALVVAADPLGGAMVGIVAAVIVAAVIVDVAATTSPRLVGLSRSNVPACRLGEPVEVALVVTNPGRRELHGWARDGWPPSAASAPRAYTLAVPAGQRRRLTTTLTPGRRGELRSNGVTLRVVGPLGLAARQRTRSLPGSVRVLPSFASRKFLPEKLARLRQLDGLVAATVRGQGTEFDSLRDYVAGDDVRSIDWRATARRTEVVVRTWRPERDRQLMLVLDSGRTSAARVSGFPRFDSSLDAALLITALARHAGDRVALLAHDRRLRCAVDAGRGTETLTAVVNATAALEPVLVETDMHAVVAQVLRRLRRRSLVVIFTSTDPEAVREGLLPAIAPLVRRHVVVVASVADAAVDRLAAGRDDAEAVYAAAAAEGSRGERVAVVAALRRRGVEVVEAPPGVFASVVADRYLDLKAAGRL